MNQFRNDFPIFENSGKEGSQLIYFDSAATSQKPEAVIQSLSTFYSTFNAPIHRGLYKLAEQSTRLYENARQTIAVFLNAQEPSEIIVTKNATEGINFIASTWAMDHIKEGDEIVLTQLEHHANLIPWQFVAKQKKAILKFIRVNDQGELLYEDITSLITQRTKLVAFTHISNAIGTVIDPKPIIEQARKVGAKILIDACQSVPHKKINVQDLRCDFLVFSGHKILGPTGIGILYINKSIQHEVRPYQFGGGMLLQASYQDASFLKAPFCYEAGTQPVAELIALAQAVEYLTKRISYVDLQKLEASLCARLIDGLKKLKQYKILGPTKQLSREGHLVSFVHAKYHAHDIAAYLDQFGICVRAGHFCAQPLADRLGIISAVRVSFYLYNSLAEVDLLLEKLSQLKF